jgi:hypothetical protein
MNIPGTPIDWKHYDASHAQGISDTAFARSIGLSQPAFAHRKKKRHLEEAAHRDNGHLPAIRPSQPIATQRISVLSAQPIASEVDDLKSRVATLEAFMAAMQAEHRSAAQSIAAQPIAVHRNESIQWVSRGLQVTANMLAAIDTYAQQHRLEKREVLDLALRRFFEEAER